VALSWICFPLLLIHRPRQDLFFFDGGILAKPEIGTGTHPHSRSNSALPLLIAGLVLRSLFHREQQQPFHPYCNAICVFMIIACLAFLVGIPLVFNICRTIQTQLAQLMLFIFSGCIFLTAARQLQDIRWLKAITYIFIAIGSIPLLPALCRLLFSILGAF